MKKYMCCLIIVTGTMHALFDYDRAVGAAQHEQWEAAGETFKSLVTAHPDRPDVLYDAGVVAYKNEDLEQAKVLFESAAQHESAPRTLKEQAYFNKANTHVKQEQLKEALSAYDQVLMLNPENEQAQHNAQVVKEMLKQKEQQQQQQNKQDNKDNDSQDKQDQDKQQQNQDQSKQDNKDRQDNDRDDDRQDQSQKDGQEGQDSKSQDGSKASDKNNQKQNQQQEGDDKSLDQEGDQKDDERDRPDQQERKPQRQQQRQRRREPEKNSQKDKQSEQQEDDHKASLEKEKRQAEQQAQEQDMQQEEKEQGLGKEGVAPIQLDPALERVLAKREDRDAQLNKQVIKALVGETAGQNGKNSW